MKSYVAIEGSGELSTKISGGIESQAVGVVAAAENAELRNLTIENLHFAGVGIYVDSVSPRFSHLWAEGSQAARPIPSK